MTNDDHTGSLPTPAKTDETTKPAMVADTAANAASDVASTAATGAKDAVGEVATQAQVVAGEAKRQIGTVVDQTRRELSQQADERTRQAAGGLRTLADQANALAEGRPQDAGPLADYVGDARTRVSNFAERLEAGGPQGLLDDVTNFARRRPIMFLAASVGAGFLVGRLARAGRAAQQDGSTATTTPESPSGPSTDELPGAAQPVDAPLINTPLVTTAP